MKNIVKFLFVLGLLAAGTTAVSAQKFGIINSQEIIVLMPELDSVQLQLEAFEAEMRTQLETITVEFNQKLEKYQAESATLTDAVRQIREKDLTDLQTRHQEFQIIASQDRQRLEQSLMQPVIQRITDAIQKVGKDGGYTMIFDDASAVYINEATVVNILSEVKKVLGIPENAQPRLAGQQAAR